MNSFILESNKNKLLEGSNKLLTDKLKIHIDKGELYENISHLVNLIKEKYSIDNYDLKTLNNICLTNIKNFYENNNNNTDNTNDRYNTNETDNNDVSLHKKISDLESKRHNILNNDIKNSIINKQTQTNKSFIISSLKNENQNKYDISTINLDYNTTAFKPSKLILPKYLNKLLPYITLNIFIDNNILKYNYICTFKNDIWDLWSTEDTDLFTINNNIINYTFTDYNDNIINFDISKINILNYKIDDKFIYLNLEKYINYFHNNKNSYIIIENKKKKYNKEIAGIDSNFLIIYNNSDMFFNNNLSTSKIILLENQFSLVLNYYSK